TCCTLRTSGSGIALHALRSGSSGGADGTLRASGSGIALHALRSGGSGGPDGALRADGTLGTLRSNGALGALQPNGALRPDGALGTNRSHLPQIRGEEGILVAVVGRHAEKVSTRCDARRQRGGDCRFTGLRD